MKQRINTILLTLIMFFTLSNINIIYARTNDNVQYYKAYKYTQKMSYASEFDA